MKELIDAMQRDYEEYGNIFVAHIDIFIKKAMENLIRQGKEAIIAMNEQAEIVLVELGDYVANPVGFSNVIRSDTMSEEFNMIMGMLESISDAHSL